MKIDFLSNGRKYRWGFWHSLLYFFFASLDPNDGQLIKAEAATFQGGGKTRREFYTWRAFWAYLRYMPSFTLREYAERMAKVLELPPQVAWRIGAIAQDGSTVDNKNGGSVGSATQSHTIGAGSNQALFAGTGYRDTNNYTASATYAGSAMTTDKSDYDGGIDRTYVFHKVAPASGAQNFVVTFSGTITYDYQLGIVSYTGVVQSSEIDVTGSYQSNPGVTTATVTLVTTVANDWIFNCIEWVGTSNFVVKYGETSRWNINIYGAGADKATTTAGSYNTGWDWTNGQSGVLVAVAFKPAITGSASPSSSLLFMGAG